GSEIWYTAASSGNARELRAVTPEGVARNVSGYPGMMRLFDVSTPGHVLLSRDNVRMGIYGKAPGDPRERDLSWLDWSLLRQISPDGKSVFFDEENEGIGPNYVTCIRGTNGSPVVRLGEGSAGAISPDGRKALSRIPQPGSPLTIYPTGPGQKTQVDVGGRDLSFPILFLPDSRRVFVAGRGAEGAPAAWILDLETSSWTTLEVAWPGAIRNAAVSPDGSTLAVSMVGGATLLIPLDGGAPKPGPRLEADELVATWHSDGTSIFVQRGGLPLVVTKVNLESGAREPFMELRPADTGGVTRVFNANLTLDGEAYAYGYNRTLSDLYVGDGLL
ncbi:MAG TPA: hypothetical protein VFS09_11135, partial [Candidatus Eisenbacteria bacterium]|nr:hypothetical protein [Candidatus Eisenbacteria bacterium]